MSSTNVMGRVRLTAAAAAGPVGTESARIDGVSGATVTSDGYRKSRQAALDAAHGG